MAAKPTPPILIPRTPTSPLDPTLRTSLQAAILNPQTIKTLRNTLETETQADAWQEKVKQRTLQLLEQKEYRQWEDLLGVIVREARGVEELDDDDDDDADGDYREGKGKRNEAGKDEREQKVDIRVPEKAIAEASKVVKGALEEKEVELEPEGKGFWD